MTLQKTVSPTTRPILQLEGAATALVCGFVYAQSGGGWAMFAMLLLAPDIFMFGYLAGPRVGAALYNLVHSYLAPVALAAIGTAADSRTPVLAALIWGAHIGMDRALGYGLKYRSGFKDTHLTRI